MRRFAKEVPGMKWDVQCCSFSQVLRVLPSVNDVHLEVRMVRFSLREGIANNANPHSTRRTWA